jgi:hypothetical protein
MLSLSEVPSSGEFKLCTTAGKTLVISAAGRGRDRRGAVEGRGLATRSAFGWIRKGGLRGGRLDPLTPNSNCRGETGCGTILAGGGGWASSPIDSGGYCTAPSIWPRATPGPIRAKPIMAMSVPKPVIVPKSV